MKTTRLEPVLLWAGLGFIGLPILNLAGFASLSASIPLTPLGLSFASSLCALFVIVLLGTPIAWALVEPRRWLFRLWVELCLVLPPAVVGVSLLQAFGTGGWLEGLGPKPFSFGAVVLAQVIVASPFYVQAARIAFLRVDRDLILLARTLGATPRAAFRQVVLPMAWSGLVAGAALAWLRAMGEFGATLLFAGNRPGVTQTMPLAIYTAMERSVEEANVLALVYVCFAFLCLLVLRRFSRGEP